MNQGNLLQWKSRSQQAGGTVLGFVAGLVVGLGLALAVAVYVTKTPVPFVNKAPSRTAEQDAAEAKKNKDWDPNAPLYGKNPAKSNPAAVTPTASTSTPSASSPTKVDGKVDAKADPIAAKAAEKEAKDAKTDAKADASKDPFQYFVQAGAFRTPEDAEAQRAKLALQGLDAKVTERESAGRTVYRVRLGPFDKRDDADKAKDKLDAAGAESAIVRVQR